jgi:transposase
MAKGYRPVDRDQPFLLPPDMRQWLPAGHVVWLVIEAVRRLDTSVFHARRRTGGAGAAGYDPDMMVTLLVWAYANGITSSRRIERLCQQDVAFRVICAGHVPDHVTVARFRQQFAETAADLFAQVLVLCARLGMGKVGTVALDGTKIAGNASKDANRTEEGLRKLAADLAAAHAAADAEEDALFGKGKHGDDDPGDPFTRAERVNAALASLEAEREAREAAERDRAEAALAAARAGVPAPGNRPAAADVALAELKVARETAAYREKVRRRQEAAAAAGRRSASWRRPVPPEEYCRVREAREQLERARARAAAREQKQAEQDSKRDPARRNVTDPDSRLMPLRGGGFLQGYNAQNVTGEDGLVIATGTRRGLDKAARDGSGGGTRPSPAITAMAARLATEDGITAYRRRGHIGETFHGDLKHNQHIRRLSVRGLPRACGEWTFITAVRNLRKAITSGHLTAQSLAALAG